MSTPHDNLLASYPKLLKMIKPRANQVRRFRKFIEEKTNWLTAPASSRHHLNIPKGLLIHSIGVTWNALLIKRSLADDIPDESIVIVSLFHDIGKVGYPGKPYYLPNHDQGQLKLGIAYRINPEIAHLPHAVRSLQLISPFIKLSDYEAQAIAAHDGIYPSHGGICNLEYHHRECRLQMILHFADKWTAAIDEDGRK
jgi:hypothetical protein